MQNIAVQMTGRKALKELNSNLAMSSKRRDEVSEECIDPFMQIVMGMLAELPENGDGQTQGAALGAGEAEKMSLLFGQEPVQNSLLQVPVQHLDSGDSSGESSAEPGLLLQLLPDLSKAAEAEEMGSAVLSQLTSLRDGGGQAGSTAFFDAPKVPGVLFEEQAIASEAETVSAFVGESSFMEALAIVKEKMSGTGAEAEENSNAGRAELDPGMLQNESAKVDTQSPFDFSLKAMAESSEFQLAEQITRGIQQSTAAGRSEFTLKLEPESLGAITIKLVEKAGKTTISIAAASAQTARLINSDIGVLREAVASMNAQVEEASIQPETLPGESTQQFDMAQQFAGQQFSGQQSSRAFPERSFRDGSYVHFPEGFDEAALLSPRKTTIDGLDTYI